LLKAELMSKKSPVTPAIKTTACDGGFFNGMEFRARTKATLVAGIKLKTTSKCCF